LNLLKKLLLVAGVVVGLLAIFFYASIAQALLENYYRLKELNSDEQNSELWGLLFTLVFTLPGLLVFVGSYVYAVRNKFWGVKLLWASTIANELVVLWFLRGLAFAFQNRVWIVWVIALEYLIVIFVLVLSFALAFIQRRQLTKPLQLPAR
jgi:hypothetical protein